MAIGPAAVAAWLVVVEKAVDVWAKYSAWRKRRQSMKQAKAMEKAVKSGMVLACCLCFVGCEADEALNLGNEKGESEADIAKIAETLAGTSGIYVGGDAADAKLDTVNAPVIIGGDVTGVTVNTAAAEEEE